MASWVWDLVDANGTNLTDSGIIDAKAASFTKQRGLPPVAEALLPLTGYAASIIAQDTYQPYLRGWRTDPDGTKVLRFYGPVIVDEVVGQSGGFDMVKIVAVGPQIRLGKRFTEASFTATDIGSIIKQMVDTTNSSDGETGIQTAASYTASTSVDFDARGTKPTIQAVIEQFQKQTDGVDVYVEPMEYSAGKIGSLVIVPAGSASSNLDISFGYGHGTAGNCSSISRLRNKEKMENDCNAYTDTLTARSTDATSVVAFTRMVGFTNYSGEVDQTNLDNAASGRLQRFATMDAIAEYRVTPTSAAPALFDDFDIGDSAWIDFRKGVEFRVRKQILLAKIDISEGGVERLGQIEFGTPAE